MPESTALAVGKASTASADAAQSSENARGRRRGGRGPNGRNDGPSHPVPGDIPGGRGGRGDRGRRGRGGRESIRAVDLSSAQTAIVPGEATHSEDGEVCFICASKIEHLSIAPCDHQTCHICALRLRALYKSRDCAYCKSEAPYVLFTDDFDKKYDDFTDENLATVDESLGVKYSRWEILEDAILLLRYNCPDSDCDTACLGWPHLHRHVKQKHGKSMCDLCTRHKKVFTHEHELFTVPELRRHEKFGDDRPGAVNQSGFKGHPECGFCRQRFYGDDELYEHCREKHERCHICDRRNPGSQVQYYLDYQLLEKHFEAEHFVCLDVECQENKTNVFESDMDLKDHLLSAHPNGLSKDARRDARLVDISGFDYRAPYQPPRQERDRRRVGGGGGGRGPNPNAEPLPLSSAQPLRRDELAFQRQLAVLNPPPQPPPQTVSRNHAVSPVPGHSRPASTATATRAPDLSTLSLDPAATPGPDGAQLTLQDQARQVRHTSVLQRASDLVHADQTKLTAFRNHVSAYTSSSITASELIEAFFPLFDVPSAQVAKLVRELADIYEEEGKQQDLLQALNDWLSIHANYPSLPSGEIGSEKGSNDIHPSGRRVLKLKSSTAQSSRSEVSRQSGWGNAVSHHGNIFGQNNTSSSASNSQSTSHSNSFPPLFRPGTASAASLDGQHRRGVWNGNGNPSLTTTAEPQNPSLLRPSRPSAIDSDNNNNDNNPARSGAPSKRAPGAKSGEEMFPALPAGKKPNTLVAGLTRGAVRWDSGNVGAGVNAWSGDGASGPRGGGSGTSGIDSGGGRKGKKGKQVLYKFG